MTLRMKTLLIVGLTLTGLIIILYVVSVQIMQRSYLQLEEESTHSNIQRVRNTISNDLENLDSTTADWAHWDETYFFIQGENESYVEDNLTLEALMNLRVNMMLFYDTSGELVYSAAVDLQNGAEESLPQNVADYINPNSPLLAHDSESSHLSGAFHVSDGIALFAARPILTNDLQGPIQGTLILAYYLDAERIGLLSETLDLSIEAYAMGEADTEIEELALSSEGISQRISDDLVSGYTVVTDIEGDPVLILQVDMPRDIYKQGERSLLHFFVSLLILGIAAVMATLWLIERLVLSRLTVLSESVTKVRDTGDLTVPIIVAGEDELSSLANSVNGMLTDLAESQGKLQSINQLLEKRVEERTAALMETNRQLEQEIAERQQAQIELAQARDQALEALRLKAQILANISHDARTPLTVITLSVDGFRTGRYGEINEKQCQVLDRISLSVQELLGFITNLLESSELEGNHKLKPTISAFDPRELVNEVASIVKPLADRKGLHFQTQVAEEVNDQLYGDESRLKQILNNLATNAVKFTKEGSIEVNVYLPDSTHWALEVSDTGIGIPKEEQNNIFEAFWQVDGSMTREADRGVGLGLSIVNQLAILMNAEVKLRSEVGLGSTFTVVLPLVSPKGDCQLPRRK